MCDGAALTGRAREALSRAGLPPELPDRLPHQLSGGQKAHVGIARAIAPRLLLLDRLRREDGLVLLFVSHDLSVVRMMCGSLVLVQHGRVVRTGPSRAMFEAPRAAYTRALPDAVPHFDPHGAPVMAFTA